MAAKKDDNTPDETIPQDTGWLALSQPTDERIPTVATVQKTGPWWVKDKAGNQFATYVLDDSLTVTDESPFNRSGDLRTFIPTSAKN